MKSECSKLSRVYGCLICCVSPPLSSWRGIYSLHQQFQPLERSPLNFSEIRYNRRVPSGTTARRSTHCNGYFKRIKCTEIAVEREAVQPPANYRIIRLQGFQNRGNASLLEIYNRHTNFGTTATRCIRFQVRCIRF